MVFQSKSDFQLHSPCKFILNTVKICLAEIRNTLRWSVATSITLSLSPGALFMWLCEQGAIQLHRWQPACPEGNVWDGCICWTGPVLEVGDWANACGPYQHPADGIPVKTFQSFLLWTWLRMASSQVVRWGSNGLLRVRKVAVLAFLFEKQQDKVNAQVLRLSSPPIQTVHHRPALWQNPQSCAGRLLEEGPDKTDDNTKITG